MLVRCVFDRRARMPGARAQSGGAIGPSVTALREMLALISRWEVSVGSVGSDGSSEYRVPRTRGWEFRGKRWIGSRGGCLRLGGREQREESWRDCWWVVEGGLDL